jgi:hypothetical protein
MAIIVSGWTRRWSVARVHELGALEGIRRAPADQAGLVTLGSPRSTAGRAGSAGRRGQSLPEALGGPGQGTWR